MTSKGAIATWVTTSLLASALVGLITKTFLSIYLWEELTHSGDYHIMGRTPAGVAKATLVAVLICGLFTLALATAQFFATLQFSHRNHLTKPKRFAIILALASWLLLFLPAAIHAYLFNPNFLHLR